MNIHPIFVHFPIAFLVVYALFEVARFGFLTKKHWYEPVKVLFLAIGVGFSFIALSTGELAEELIKRSDLIETHSLFATISTWIFGVLLVAYIVDLISWEESLFKVKRLIEKTGIIWQTLLKVKDVLLIPGVAIGLAVLGLVAVTITGALGGAIVYGPDVDPVVHFIYSLFF